VPKFLLHSSKEHLRVENIWSWWFSGGYDSGWPLVWKTWKCQGIWELSGKCHGFYQKSRKCRGIVREKWLKTVYC